jgi:thiopeptide-type bacteriocin biosynthesis protein
VTAPWLALYVFHAGDQDSAIVKSIGPCLRRLRESGWIARYFFVRYWNGGPHLRIRTECLQPAADIERELRLEIGNFLAEAPQELPDVVRYAADSARIHTMEQRVAGEQTDLIEPLEPLQPSGTIQTRPYRFDEYRYGGTWAADDSHDHAWASTEIACAVLELTATNAASKLVFALHAAAVVPGVLGASAPAALGYFRRCSEWADHLGDLSNEVSWEARGFLPYARQGAALDNVRAILDQRDPRAPRFWLLLLEIWRRELRRRHEYLVSARTAHGLTEQPDHLIIDAMHLLLNRLGIDFTTECYLYQLVARILEESVTVGVEQARES